MEISVCLPPEWLLTTDHPRGFADLDYDEDWPPGIGKAKSMRPSSMNSDVDDDVDAVPEALVNATLDSNAEAVTEDLPDTPTIAIQRSD